MAKPNYQFEKRQRDLAKKSKQEEKRRQKLSGKAVVGDASSSMVGNPFEAVPSRVSNATPTLPDGEETPNV